MLNTIYLNLVAILTYIKFFFYNLLIGEYTIILYRNFLERIPENSVVLDIGIGNCYSLLKNKQILIEKKIKIVGVDIDSDSINLAKKIIKANDMDNYIQVYCQDIFTFDNSQKFDFIYFSNSYSVIPEINKMMNFTYNNFLKESGELVLSTTLDSRFSNFKDVVKPFLKRICLGIDFGRFITIDNFINDISKDNFVITNMENVHQNWIPIWGNIDIFTCVLNKNKLKNN